MGNQQSGGLHACSRGQMYTHRSEVQSSKFDLDNRVGYGALSKERFQVQRTQNTQEQVVPQQQGQEDIAELEKAYKKVLRERAETAEHLEDELQVFEGVCGSAYIMKDEVVQYTDLAGKKHREKYNKNEIRKIFPKGIAYGGLTKTIWFKDVVTRDECFDLMTNKSVVADPTKFRAEEPNEADNRNSFEGINEGNVVVNANNFILYTDLNGVKRCDRYSKRDLRKCFPCGITGGRLTKTMWFKNEVERDSCFKRMMQRGDDIPKRRYHHVLEDQKFSGFYGSVLLHPDSQIEFTSISGQRVKCYYEPNEIRECFPKGISYGRLEKTIWFQTTYERKKCIDAMRRM